MHVLRQLAHRGRNVRRSLAIAAASACILQASPTRADVSSWLAVGGGYGFKRSDRTDSFDSAPALGISLGVGSNPLASVVAGGLVRSTTYFSLGTDLGVAARVASGGFARGQWGLALDVGPTWRIWQGAGDYGRFPLSAMITGGAPWGVQLGIGGEFLNLEGGSSARGVVALLEIDLLRLTVMRQGATDRWWENPSPAGGRKRAAARPGPWLRP